MQELRFVAVSEDGRYAVLAVPGRSARFTLPIDERLRAVALGQTSRLAQYEIEVESPLRPKEIQARIRAGETVEEIADAAGIAVERVRWFEGPVLAERAYVAEQAQSASVRRQGDAIPSSPGPRLGEIVTERLRVFGADPEDAQWDARKRGDGSWQVQLAFISGGRLHTADWIFDPRRRHVLPDDDNAARMSLPGTEPPQPAAPAPGEATVTHLAPRLNTASPFGPVAMGNGARHERPGAGRPAAPEPRIPERDAPEPRQAQAPAAAAPEAPSARPPAPPAPPAPAAPPDPARVAAQVPRAAPPGRAPQPARHARPVPEAEGRRDTAPPAAAAEPGPPPQAPTAVSPARSAGSTGTASTAGTAAAAAPPAEPEPPAPAEAVPAEVGRTEAEGEQATRQGRKTARGRRSSVPSWDEIMFGNSRGRD